VSDRRRAKPVQELPQGLVFVPEFVSETEQAELLAFVNGVDFRGVQMHGVTAKRRVRQFGWHYSFESFRLTPADPVPDVFASIRDRSAALAGIDGSDWEEALLTEYATGAGIGWHRDAPAFGIVAGISLLGACRMRFQRSAGNQRLTTALQLPPRSIYLLTGEARSGWQHMIPPTKELRYSITFRTLRKRRQPAAGQTSRTNNRESSNAISDSGSEEHVGGEMR
jgi:DNA oxidative demethylase